MKILSLVFWRSYDIKLFDKLHLKEKSWEYCRLYGLRDIFTISFRGILDFLPSVLEGFLVVFTRDSDEWKRGVLLESSIIYEIGTNFMASRMHWTKRKALSSFI
jgi:hypothetical protein